MREIDGKDAGLMLLRDIALRGKDSLLDRADLILVPIFNADGHERSSPFNRPNQRGPGNQGWRTTAQNLNLNRDYLKADTPEMRAMRGFINRLDPALILDLHVSDGIDYQYDITFTFPVGRLTDAFAGDRPLLDSRYRPAITTALNRGGHIRASTLTDRCRAALRGWRAQPDTPRFSTGYGELPASRRCWSRPIRQAVPPARLGTYVLIEESLRRSAPSEAASPRRSPPTARPARRRRCDWKPVAKPLFTIPASRASLMNLSIARGGQR